MVHLREKLVDAVASGFLSGNSLENFTLAFKENGTTI